ncbi:MAG: hypothetical protein COA83_07365 [Methylophaga sp.]|nr:MAG: hypothetical protein COA83_07365 [Methylophaga sp.]
MPRGVSFQVVLTSISQQEPSSSSPWVKGVIIADNMRLADFIDELNRYYKGRIFYDYTAVKFTAGRCLSY